MANGIMVVVSMAQILRSKNLATKFQILLEVAANQPNVQQKDIARKLGITSQAVSEYSKELIKDGWLSSQGRSRYRVTREGVDWILRMTRELQSYSSFASKVVSDISTSTAIAEGDLSGGQAVSLYMKGGLLYASADAGGKGARGKTMLAARHGEDVGICDVEGVIDLESGTITVGRVPSVQRGGSRNTDSARLTEEVNRAKLVGVMGVEALVAVTRIGLQPDHVYGVKEASIEAAYCGLPVLVVCAEEEVPALERSLGEEHLTYRIVDLEKGANSATTR